MRRILIVGGYGAFGSRVAERLAREADLELIIAGRDLDRAQDFVSALGPTAKARLSTAVIDALAVSADRLRFLAPSVVVNASGPFQSHDYTLARACIAARCHYVDIADARAFVTGISALDTEAKIAGVAVISGASTVPGLSSAVVKALEPNFGAIHTIEIAISPGSGFEPGEAAAAAGLSYLGKPIRIPGRPKPRTVYGWQGLKRLLFPGLGKRWTSYCDVPDLDLFPQRYPSLERIEFRAGLEVALFQFGLWMLSWPARVRLIPKPQHLARVLTALKSKLSFLGTNRGGMRVAVSGLGVDGKTRMNIWSLAGEKGHGLFVPVSGAVILTRALARGFLIYRGAGACFQHFTLQEFEDEIADLLITAGPVPLYKRVLGKDYSTLPAAVAELHDVRTPAVWRGTAEVMHGPSILARIVAWLMPFPRATKGEEAGFVFSVRPDGDAEVWARGFSDDSSGRTPRIFRSRQFEKSGRLVETVKGARFEFRVSVDADGQRLHLERMTIFGIPVPRALYPTMRTLESERDGRYHFDVEALLPMGLGLLVRYRGWLEKT